LVTSRVPLDSIRSSGLGIADPNNMFCGALAIDEHFENEVARLFYAKVLHDMVCPMTGRGGSKVYGVVLRIFLPSG
jgi:hypothetical protein